LNEVPVNAKVWVAAAPAIVIVFMPKPLLLFLSTPVVAVMNVEVVGQFVRNAGMNPWPPVTPGTGRAARRLSRMRSG
jgi:hypothetical protein